MNNDVFWAAFQDEIEKVAATPPGKTFVKGWSAPVKPEPSYVKGTTGPITVQSLRAEDKKRAELEALIRDPSLERGFVRHLKTRLSNLDKPKDSK